MVLQSAKRRHARSGRPRHGHGPPRGFPKRGLAKRTARGNVGELYLADIGVPPSVYQRLGPAIESPFGRADVVRVGR